MKTFNNLDTKAYIRITSFNSIQFNIMQFNNYLNNCYDIEYVARSFDSFLNSLLRHEKETTDVLNNNSHNYETENTKNLENHLESN